jgi:hypothetical protein
MSSAPLPFARRITSSTTSRALASQVFSTRF